VFVNDIKSVGPRTDRNDMRPRLTVVSDTLESFTESLLSVQRNVN